MKIGIRLGLLSIAVCLGAWTVACFEVPPRPKPPSLLGYQCDIETHAASQIAEVAHISQIKEVVPSGEQTSMVPISLDFAILGLRIYDNSSDTFKTTEICFKWKDGKTPPPVEVGRTYLFTGDIIDGDTVYTKASPLSIEEQNLLNDEYEPRSRVTFWMGKGASPSADSTSKDPIFYVAFKNNGNETVSVPAACATGSWFNVICEGKVYHIDDASRLVSNLHMRPVDLPPGEMIAFPVNLLKLADFPWPDHLETFQMTFCWRLTPHKATIQFDFDPQLLSSFRKENP